MTAIGADVDDLDLLARRFRAAAGHLESSRATLEAHLRGSAWAGPDAERFRQVWSRHHRVVLSDAARACFACSKSLTKHQQEQINASTPERSAATTSRSTIDGPSGPGHRSSSHHGALSTPAQPESIIRLDAGVQVTLASALVGVNHDVELQEFDDGHSRLTLTSTRRAGVQGSAGASLHIGDSSPLDLSTEATLSGSVITRDSYLVDSDGAWGLLARIEGAKTAKAALHSAASAVPGGPAVGILAPGIGKFGRWLADHLPGPFHATAERLSSIDIAPSPSRSERLVEVSLSASAGAETIPFIGPKADADANVTLRVGRATGSTMPSSIFEIEGQLAVEVRSKLIGGRSWSALGDGPEHAAALLRIEVPDGASRSHPILITTTESAGDSIRYSTTALDPSSMAGISTSALATQALKSFNSNNPDEALAILRRIRIPEEAMATSVATFTDNALVPSASGQVGEGLTVGGAGVIGIHRMNRAE